MVVSLFWIQSWAIVAISVCVLFTIVLTIAVCLCCEEKKKSHNQVYVLNDNGLLKDSDKSLFDKMSKRRYSNGHCNSTPNNDKLKIIDAHNDLSDSVDVTDHFNHCVLQIGSPVHLPLTTPKDDDCDVMSCISTSSRTSFYSIFARKSSITDTIRSALSQPDLQVI